MTVKELITALSELPEDWRVLVMQEDEKGWATYYDDCLLHCEGLPLVRIDGCGTMVRKDGTPLDHHVRPRKWERQIVGALTTAGRPLTAAEITRVVLGDEPRGWLSLQQAMQGACRRGVIRRIGSAPHGKDAYRYAIGDVSLAGTAAAPGPQGRG